MLEPAPAPPRGLKLLGWIALVAAVVIVAVGLYLRFSASRELVAWTHDQATPTVTLAKLAGGGAQDMVLPGSVQPFASAAIRARVPGYLKRWTTDIGAVVKQGQVLAEIDSPELDQQVTQARADLTTAQANQKLAESTAKRWADLLAKGFVTPPPRRPSSNPPKQTLTGCWPWRASSTSPPPSLGS